MGVRGASRLACGVVAALLAWLAPVALAARPRLLGPAPAREGLQLVLPLKVDGAGLERLATEVSDPTSFLYGHYESISELSRRFGAGATARRRVLAYLRAHGAWGVRIDATGLFADATLPVGTAERLFAASLQRFQAANDARYVAPASTVPPRVPKALAGSVTGVIGLDTQPLPTQSNIVLRRARGAPMAAQQASELPRTGTPAGCAAGQAAGETGGNPSTAAFTPNQYLTAYDFDPLHSAGFLGQGQRVALIELDGVDRSDVAAFGRCFGLPVPPISEHLVGISTFAAPGSETTLDLDMLDATAPELSAIDVYETSNQATAFITALTRPFHDPARKPSVVSISLGICDPDLDDKVDALTLETADKAIAEASISGTTVLAASGDAGSTECIDSSGTPVFDRSLGINGMTESYPATSPDVLAVGGTELALTPANQIADQVVWNDAPARLVAGGGGFDSDYHRPPWQMPFISSRVGTIGGVPARALPDVAMLATSYAVYCTTADCQDAVGAPWIAAAGTSAATPLLAGGVALVDQDLEAHRDVYAGAPASLLYFEAENTAARNYLFRDVTTGSNDLGPYLSGSGGQLIGCCTAGPGYDEASGFGSVDIAHLANEYLAVGLPSPHVRVGVKLPPHQHPVRRGRLVVVVSCSTGCHLYPIVFFTIGRGRVASDFRDCVSAGCFGLTAQTERLSRAGSKRFVLRFPRVQLNELRSALRRHVRVRAYALGEVDDPRPILANGSSPERIPYKRSAVEKLTLTS